MHPFIFGFPLEYEDYSDRLRTKHGILYTAKFWHLAFLIIMNSEYEKFPRAFGAQNVHITRQHKIPPSR